MEFDPDQIERHGWRQGSRLGPALHARAATLAPSSVQVSETDWLIVVSHDCDVVNGSLEKEPVVEVLRAAVLAAPESRLLAGRNPRELCVNVEGPEPASVLHLRACVHDRWFIPRELLCDEPAGTGLSDKPRRLLVGWLSKRYTRAAFPNAFNLRWSKKQSSWQKLLERHSKWMQAVYVRLNTSSELTAEQPYEVHVLVAAPRTVKRDPDWPRARDTIEDEIGGFWRALAPGIVLGDDVDVVTTEEITLAEREDHQRFDADWISFQDGSASTPTEADLVP